MSKMAASKGGKPIGATGIIFYSVVCFAAASVMTNNVDNIRTLPVKRMCSKKNIHSLDRDIRLLLCGVCPKGKYSYVASASNKFHCKACPDGHYNDGTMVKCKRCRNCTNVVANCTAVQDTVCQRHYKRLKKEREKNISYFRIRHEKTKSRRLLREFHSKACKPDINHKNCFDHTTSAPEDPGRKQPINQTTEYNETESKKTTELEEEEPQSFYNDKGNVVLIIAIGTGVFFVVSMVSTVTILLAWKRKNRKLHGRETQTESVTRSTIVSLNSISDHNLKTYISECSDINSVESDEACNLSKLNLERADLEETMNKSKSESEILSVYHSERNSKSSFQSYRSIISIPVTLPTSSYEESMNTVFKKVENVERFHKLIGKNVHYENKNILTTYQQVRSTQTPERDLPRNMFNGLWDAFETFNQDGGRLFKGKSSAELLIPEGAVAKGDNLEIHGAVFTDLTQMREVFRLDPDEWITSVAVEFYKPDKNPFLTDVIVCLQHCLSHGHNRAMFKVFWFRQDEKGDIVKELVLAEKSSLQDDLPWFEFGSENTVLIHTRHFSGFVCIYCGHQDIPISLTAMVFGKHLFKDSVHHEVCVSLFLWDTKCFIKDFHEYYTCMMSKGMEMFSKKEIELMDQTPRDSLLICTLQPCGDDADKWQHTLRPDNQNPIFEQQQKIKLHKVVKCCRESGPFQAEWAMTGKQTRHTEFQCIVDIEHVLCETEDDADTRTTIYISDFPPSVGNQYASDRNDELKRLDGRYENFEHFDRTRNMQEKIKAVAKQMTVQQAEDFANKYFGIQQLSSCRPDRHLPDILLTKMNVLNECFRRNPDDFEKLLSDHSPELPWKKMESNSFTKPMQEVGEVDETNPKVVNSDDEISSRKVAEDDEVRFLESKV